MYSKCWPNLVWYLVWLMALQAGSGFSGEAQLNTLITQALRWNPRVAAARTALEIPLAHYRELDEFYDPHLEVRGGGASRSRSVPGASEGPGLTNDAVSTEGGLEWALRPGAYLSMGAAQRQLRHVAGGNRYQNMMGVQLVVPLLRDRGFREFDLQRNEAWVEVQLARSRWYDAIQDVARQVALAYVATEETRALYKINQNAAQRVERLLKEAEDLVRLKVVPKYQLHQGRLEVVTHKEAVHAALVRNQAALRDLAEACGVEPDLLPPARTGLVAWARACAIPVVSSPDTALVRQGEYLRLQQEWVRVQVQLAQQREERKSDLSFLAGTSWQNDSRHHPFFATANSLDDHHFGASVQVVWSRPLSFTGVKERLAALHAREAELREKLRGERIRVNSALKREKLVFQGARERLRIIEQAVAAARQTLKAEESRFRLGEGRSRSVLDAQKDLTDVIRLQTQIAGEVLRSFVRYARISGDFLRFETAGGKSASARQKAP